MRIDGIQHGFAPNAASDRKRDAAFAMDGFLTLRFTKDDVHRNMEDVIETVFLRGQERLPACSPGDVP
ncbi:MAG TPA: DUF559 domain-containing protein [Beijerinckiaceae bacterium]|nr:DUF559 domain-containing protein [Beijerinckiaceae bacterium]